MEVIVISTTDKFHTEIPIVIRMFQLGLKHFHLRKPKWDTEKMEEYLKEIPAQYHQQIIIHSHHGLAIKYKLKGIHITRKHRKKGRQLRWRIWWMRLKRKDLYVTRTFHKLSDLTNIKERFNYVFLTPLYDGISRQSHSGGFSKRAVTKILAKTKFTVHGMGGVGPDKFEELHELGFAGGCLLGSIWEYEGDKIEVYKEAVEISKRLRQKEQPDDLIG